MDNDIEQFVKNCPECSKNRPRLTDSTDEWEDCAPWERLHMDWLHEAEHGSIADAGSGWLEAFLCTDRSTRFGIPYTIVSDKGKEYLTT